MKYKVGDKVLIKEDLVPGNCYDGIHFAYGMNSFIGQVLTIKGIYNHQGVDYYTVKECEWSFSDGMIAGYALVKYDTIGEFSDFLKDYAFVTNQDGSHSLKFIEKDKDIMKDFKIKNYNNYNNKVVTVTFEDGTQEKAVCNNADKFDFERGLEVCLMKHIFGADKYKSMIKDAMKQLDAIDKAEISEKQRKELIERKRAKAARKKAKRKAKERAERIADMKTAYMAALKECNMDYYRECECGGICE